MTELEIYNEIEFKDFDANHQGQTTSWVDVRTCEVLTWYIAGGGDAHGTHVIEMQLSPDGDAVSKANVDNNITGLGNKTIDCTGLSYVRFKCKTPQSVDSLVNIWVVPFRKESND